MQKINIKRNIKGIKQIKNKVEIISSLKEILKKYMKNDSENVEFQINLQENVTIK